MSNPHHVAQHTPSSQQRNPNICIIGAGPVGAALACALGQQGIHVALIDKADLTALEDPLLDGRAYAISAGPQHYLSQCGIWQHLPAPPCPIETIYVTDNRVDGQTSDDFLKLDQRDAPQAFGWMTRARSLRIALNRSLEKTPNLSVYTPTTAKITPHAEHVDVELSNGQELTTQLIVAADGRNSFLRRQAHIPVTKLPYNQTAIVGLMAHEFPHDFAALEHFLPHGPFAQLPLRGTERYPNLSAFVWSETPEAAPRYKAMSDKLFSKQLMARLQGRGLGEVAVIGPRWSYPLSAQYASQYGAQRMLLIGDAAHGVHPIAGQGLNLGYRDIRVLTDILSGAYAQHEDLGSPELINRYQQQCRPANMLMLAATDTLDKLFSNNNPILRPLRNLGLSAFSRMPNLRKKFVHTAMGL